MTSYQQCQYGSCVLSCEVCHISRIIEFPGFLRVRSSTKANLFAWAYFGPNHFRILGHLSIDSLHRRGFFQCSRGSHVEVDITIAGSIHVGGGKPSSSLPIATFLRPTKASIDNKVERERYKRLPRIECQQSCARVASGQSARGPPESLNTFQLT